MMLERLKQFVKEKTSAGSLERGVGRQSSHGRSQGRAPWQGWEWIDVMSACVETEMKLSYLTCPTYWAQCGACLSQNWLCSFRTLWARSSENKSIYCSYPKKRHYISQCSHSLRHQKSRLMGKSYLKWCSRQIHFLKYSDIIADNTLKFMGSTADTIKVNYRTITMLLQAVITVPSLVLTFLSLSRWMKPAEQVLKLNSPAPYYRWSSSNLKKTKFRLLTDLPLGNSPWQKRAGVPFSHIGCPRPPRSYSGSLDCPWFVRQRCVLGAGTDCIQHPRRGAAE